MTTVLFYPVAERFTKTCVTGLKKKMYCRFQVVFSRLELHSQERFVVRLNVKMFGSFQRCSSEKL